MPGSQPGGAPRFRLRGALQWRELDGEWVVRAEPLGSLYQLDAWAAAVLGLLEAGALSRAELLAQLADALGTAGADLLDTAGGDARAHGPAADPAEPCVAAGAPDRPGRSGGAEDGPRGATAAHAPWPGQAPDQALGTVLDQTLARLVADDLVAPSRRP